MLSALPSLDTPLAINQYATASGKTLDLPVRIPLLSSMSAHIYGNGMVSAEYSDGRRPAILSKAHPSHEGIKQFYAFWMDVFHDKVDHTPELAEFFLKMSHRKILQDPMNPCLFFDRENESFTNDGYRVWPLLQMDDDFHLSHYCSEADNAYFTDPCYVLANRPAIKFHYLTEPEDHEFECTAGINIGEIKQPGERPTFFEALRFAEEYAPRPPMGTTITHLFDSKRIDAGLYY